MDIHKELLDLVMKSARALFSEETGFLHYFKGKKEPPYQAVPVVENALFALALCRQKTVEGVQEGKALLERLFAYQLPSGLFPRYLHDFPHGFDQQIGNELFPIFSLLYQHFHLVLGADFSNRLCDVLSKLPVTKPSYNPESTPEQLANCLTYFLLTKSQEAVSLKNDMRLLWNNELKVYTGPFYEMQFIKGEQEITLYDLYMSVDEGFISPRLHTSSPALLKGALIFEEPAREILPSSKFALSWTKNYHVKRGLYPFVFQWKGGIFALFVPLAKQVHFDEKSRITIELGKVPNVDMKEDSREVVFYFSEIPGMKFLVNGTPANTFRKEDHLVIEDEHVAIDLVFHASQGIFQGHLSKGCFPTEMANFGKSRYEAYQWQLFFRTIAREDPCTITIDFNYRCK